MTVAELIEKLREMPPDARVQYYDSCCENMAADKYCDLASVDLEFGNQTEPRCMLEFQ